MEKNKKEVKGSLQNEWVPFNESALECILSMGSWIINYLFFLMHSNYHLSNWYHHATIIAILYLHTIHVTCPSLFSSNLHIQHRQILNVLKYPSIHIGHLLGHKLLDIINKQRSFGQFRKKVKSMKRVWIID